MTRSRAVLLAGLAVIIAFALGSGWQYVRAERAEAALEETRRDLAFTRLESTLAAAAIAAQRGAYTVAFQLASEFYTALQQWVDRAPPQAAESLRAILASRDATIAMISRESPDAGDQLATIFVHYRVAIGGPEQAIPLPGPAVQDTQ